MFSFHNNQSKGTTRLPLRSGLLWRLESMEGILHPDAAAG